MTRPALQTAWPADEVKRIPIASLVPYARNARTHSDEQIAQIAASMREWGFTIPVLRDEQGGIIAGHGRVLAARLNEYTEVPCVTARGWSEAKKRAYVIADNKLTLNGGWDDEMLGAELAALIEDKFDIGLIGFDDDEVAALLAEKTDGLTDPDDVPPLPETPASVVGDVWLLGQHRLVCGDSTDPHSVAKALGRFKPHLMVTDPPYGVEYDAAFRNKVRRADGSKVSARATGKVLNDDRADWREAWALFPGTVAYVWHAGLFAGVVADSLAASGFITRSQIIWAKSNFAIGRGDYHWQHEPCWYAVKKGEQGHYNGDRTQSTLWSIDKPQKSETGHSTQKPVECMKRPIENNSKPGQAIYEPFSGSGTTLIAAETSGRICCAIELNPAYVDMAVQRWQEFTGREATLEESGATFADVARKRLKKANRRPARKAA